MPLSLEELPELPFQSHAGSIEAPGEGLSFADQHCFNPTLVRLRPATPGRLRNFSLEFQSHAGSIEAWPWVLCWEVLG